MIKNIIDRALREGTPLGRYGENWHQPAHLLKDSDYKYPSIVHATQLNGGPLGFNNYLDGDAVLEMILDFRDDERDFVTVVKHGNPCGAAIGENQIEALERALQGDAMSAFGGLVGFNKEVGLEIIRQFYERPGQKGQGWIMEVIIAPSFSHEAVNYATTVTTILEELKNMKAKKDSTQDDLNIFKNLVNTSLISDLCTAFFSNPQETRNLLEGEMTQEKMKEVYRSVNNKGKTNLRLLQVGEIKGIDLPEYELRVVKGGYLVQKRNDNLYLCETAEQLFQPAQKITCENSGKNLKVGVVTDGYVDPAKQEFVEFGIRMSRYLKSNAVAIVREYKPGFFQLFGFDTGQQNRVDSTIRAAERFNQLLKLEWSVANGNSDPYTTNVLRTQLEYVKSVVGDRKRDTYTKEQCGNCAFFSEAFFPNPDNIERFVAMTDIKLIVQPGGSVADKSVIAACQRYGIEMIDTGVRQFRH